MSDVSIQDDANSLWRQIWRYGLTGMVNTGVGLAVILILHMGFGAGLLISNAAGYGVGLLIAFTLNRAWTFASNANVVSSGLKFAALVAVAFAVNMALITSLQAAAVPYVFAQISGVAAYSVLVFVGAKYVVFPR